MWTFVRNDRGGALVTALFFITGLTAIASIIVFITGSERKVAHNEYTHARAFNSSDAGSEDAINWVRFTLAEIPLVADDTKMVDQTAYTDLTDPNAYSQEENKFQYDVEFDEFSFRFGDETRYVWCDFTLESEGASAKESSSMIEVQASRRFDVEQ